MYIMFDMVDNAYNYGRALIGNFFRNTAFLLRGQKEAITIQKQRRDNEQRRGAILYKSSSGCSVYCTEDLEMPSLLEMMLLAINISSLH